MASLPSYEEATSRSDWLGLVAPFVEFSDYKALCLVNRRFWHVFAPRLWRDLLVAVRRTGLDPGDDIAWWFDFVFNRLRHIRHSTRCLVLELDAREFAKGAYQFTLEHENRTLQESFGEALQLLPCVESIILDTHADLDAGFLVGSQSSISGLSHWPLVLSLGDTTAQLPSKFFESPSFQRLVYLDISAIPGSVWPVIRPGLLPSLRILKIRNKEVDDTAVASLAKLFRLRLWSLDLSSNLISDAAIDQLANRCFSAINLRSNAHIETEGVWEETGEGTSQHGPFAFIQESGWSGSFQHPERYLIDPPFYLASNESGPQEYLGIRSDCRTPVRKDTAGAVARMLSGEQGLVAAEEYKVSHGITHLNLSNNRISSLGLQKLLRVSNGRIESLACDSLPLMPKPIRGFLEWPRSASLHGILGAKHVFRPVISSSLRILRIHHSLVTNIPTLHADGLSSLARAHLAETAILDRVEKLLPQVFTPDTNPRLSSLTLTCIPRRSTGPLVARLIGFLRLLSRQEREIQRESVMASSWRSPGLLQGLRHIRFEFDSDPMEEGYSAAEDLDAEELIYSGEGTFSFFDEGFTKSRPADGSSRRASETSTSLRSSHRRLSSLGGAAPCGESDREYGEYVSYDGEWNGKTFSILVWIGPTRSGTNALINDYKRLVTDNDLQDHVGPATPAQVLAGAPPGSYLFQMAWHAAIMPTDLSPPTASQLSGMVDVLDELRKFRLRGRADYTAALQAQYSGGSTLSSSSPSGFSLGDSHDFWTGKLEVATQKSMPQARQTQYWR